MNDKPINVKRVVEVALDSAIVHDLDGWNDLLSEMVTGTLMLQDIGWKLVGVMDEFTMLLEVDGYLDVVNGDCSQTSVCKVCGGKIFETDPELSEEHGETVWSHVEDTGCDDPTPVHGDLCFCVRCLGGGPADEASVDADQGENCADPAGDDGYDSDYEDKP